MFVRKAGASIGGGEERGRFSGSRAGSVTGSENVNFVHAIRTVLSKKLSQAPLGRSTDLIRAIYYCCILFLLPLILRV